ncbi:MAG TPA: HEAT repeat domain-containing protein [Dehalococcoidia bacterium]|nr:HEAT repeat domain-containing protein [Dehalococcoidia bacterium]
MEQKDVRERIEALKYVGDEACRAAFEVLVRIGKPAVGGLIEALRTEDDEVRQVAAWALVRIGEPAVPSLVRVLMDGDESGDVRQVATWVLTRLGEVAVPALIEAIKSQRAIADQAANTVIEPSEADGQAIEEVALPRPKLRVKDLLRKAELKRQVKPRQRTAIVPFGITELEVLPAQACPGETVTISLKATNNSDAVCYYPVTLRINGEVVDAQVVSLPRKTTIPLSFAAVGGQPGYYQVEVNEATAGFTIVEPKPREVTRLGALEAKRGEPVQKLRQGEAPAGTTSSGRTAVSPEVVLAPGRLQATIDKIADYIEFGLDKVGDGLIFPIRKIVDVSTIVFKTRKRRAKKQHWAG